MTAPARRCLVMGIVNATPDSFSDGGRHDPLAHALKLAEDGADWLDVGGESTRPGAPPVGLDEELERVLPVIEAVRARVAVPVSVDTRKAAVARAAVAAGARMWNDVSALRESDAATACAALGCEVVLMHMLGDPQSMQNDPRYDDVVAEVAAMLAARAEAAMAAGVAREKIWLDPGIGFGKTADHNRSLIARLDKLVGLGFPVLLGASRKSFLGGSGDRLGGSIAAALAGRAAGAAMVRVHDVAETIQAFAVTHKIEAARG